MHDTCRQCWQGQLLANMPNLTHVATRAAVRHDETCKLHCASMQHISLGMYL
jgi:hypothetical protein